MSNSGFISHILWGVGWRLRSIYQPRIQFLLPWWDENEGRAIAGISIDRRAVEHKFREHAKISDDHSVYFTSSGRTALRWALRDAKSRKPEKREVVIPSYSCLGVLQPVIEAGLTPVFYDIDSNLLPDPSDAADCISENTLAVVAVHLMGVQMATNKLKETCTENGCFLVSDECQAIGLDPQSEYDYRIFSFTEGKTLTATGGAATGITKLPDDILFEDESRARDTLNSIARSIQNVGEPVRFDYADHRMSDVALGVLDSQLNRLDSVLEIRTNNAAKLDEILSETDITPVHSDKHLYTKYCVFFSDKQKMHAFVAYCTAEGIGLEGMYKPLHLRPEGRIYCTRKLPLCESLWERVTTIPVRPNLSAGELRRIGKALKQYIGGRL